MPFHLLAYTKATGGSVTDSDMTAAVDGEFSQRNGHYVFTEPYKLLADSIHGATVTRANIQTSTLNAVSRFNIFPINGATSIGTAPQIDNWMGYPVMIPQNEELQVAVTDTASEQATAFLWIGTDDWNRNIPNGMPPVPVFECRATCTITSIANAWASGGALTFEQNLRGGTYAVVGAAFVQATVLAVRCVFPTNRLYRGRRLRPGVMAMSASTSLMVPQTQYGPMVWGEFGRFSTFEPFTLDVWANAAASITLECRFWLVRVSDQFNVVF